MFWANGSDGAATEHGFDGIRLATVGDLGSPWLAYRSHASERMASSAPNPRARSDRLRCALTGFGHRAATARNNRSSRPSTTRCPSGEEWEKPL